MECDAFDAGFDEALQKSGRIAVAASTGVVSVVGNNQWLVTGVASPRQRNCFGNR
jgi:hypothetical protein